MVMGGFLTAFIDILVDLHTR